VSRYQKKPSPTHIHEEEEEGFTQRSALSQQRLLNPIKPAYNQIRPDGGLKLTASAFNRLYSTMDQNAGSTGHSTYCFAEIAASFINFLHYCLPSSRFYAAGDRGRCTNTPSGCHPIGLSVPPPPSSFLSQMPYLPQPFQFILAWGKHRIMLACICSGLVW